jgi:hypothetical protein
VSPQQGPVLAGGPKTGSLGDSIYCISQALMPGNPLSLVTTGDGVVTKDVTVMVAGWTMTSLSREHWYTQSVLDRDHKLSRSEWKPSAGKGKNFQLRDVRALTLPCKVKACLTIYISYHPLSKHTLCLFVCLFVCLNNRFSTPHLRAGRRFKRLYRSSPPPPTNHKACQFRWSA